jgi:hypothetical protein
LGRFLTSTSQPFFRIHEKNRANAAVNSVITPDIIERMITRAQFSVHALEIYISLKHDKVSITLGFRNELSHREEQFPISGFPRDLLMDDIKPRINSPSQHIFQPVTDCFTSTVRSPDPITETVPSGSMKHRQPQDHRDYAESSKNSASQGRNGDHAGDWMTQRSFRRGGADSVGNGQDDNHQARLERSESRSMSPLNEGDEDEEAIGAAIEESLAQQDPSDMELVEKLERSQIE